MSFSTVTVTHTYLTLGDVPATGSVSFSLTGPMRNAGTSYVASQPIMVTLNNDGQISVLLPANDDPGTIPPGVGYVVTEQIAGARQEEYSVTVPSASNGQTVDLASLLPQDTQ